MGSKILFWLAAHLTQTPEIPSDVAPDLPRALRTLLLACLAKSPEDRPADWGEVADALAVIYRDVTGQPAQMEITGPQLEARELMDKGYSLTELGYAEEALQQGGDRKHRGMHRYKIKQIALRRMHP